MAIRTAEIASAVVRPAISIKRRTRANKAACSGVSSLATVSVIGFFFGTKRYERSEAGSHSRGQRGLTAARPRAGRAPRRAVAIAPQDADPRGPGHGEKRAHPRPRLSCRAGRYDHNRRAGTGRAGAGG